MSFQQGLSGLNASSKNLSVIGNNIANANTYGNKASRAEFADVYAASLNGAGTNNVGIGTNLVSVAQQFTQGNITTTENPMDLAINGAGFFQMTDGANPPQYTRNGQFKIDRDGYFVNNAQLQLMGYPADAQGIIQPGQAVPLKLPTGGIDPQRSSEIVLEMNLDSRKKAPEAPMNFNRAETYNNATSVTAYDVRGQEVAMTLYFRRIDPIGADGEISWEVYATANGVQIPTPPDLTADPLPAPEPIYTMVFPKDGTGPLNMDDPIEENNLINFGPFQAGPTLGGAATVPFEDTQLRIDLRSVTQFGAPFGVTDLRQNGFAAGQLTSVNVDSNGIVMARYSNGRSQAAGQIEVATFRNPQGLQPMGNNMWASTFASNEAVRGVPGQGNLGVLQSGALEESNVDLTGELVNMITAQRIYQANAQTIKAQDQVLQTLVNLR